MIKAKELEKMNNDYSLLLERYGDNEKAVGWNKPKQRVRFEIMLQQIKRKFSSTELRKLRLLDVGCGLGHFYEYLNANDIEVKYVGADANSDFISHCRLKYPNGEFYNVLIENNFYESDIIVASGAFNRKFDDSPNIIKKFIQDTQRSKATVISINFLHSLAINQYEHNYYTSLSDIETVINRSCTSGFVVDGATLPGEFTIALYK